MTAYRALNALIVLVVALVLPLAGVSAQGPVTDFVTLIRTDDVMGHVRALAVAIGAREAGSEAEAQAAAYVAAALADYGYEVELQEFDTTSFGEEAEEGTAIRSRNVIGTRVGDDQIVIVGAHMDSVSIGTGADDNGSGVAALLAAAEALAGVETSHTLVFVGFGAEESGDPTGATYFVQSLGEDAANVIAMLNIDTVGVGTTLNVYAGAVIEWGESEDQAPTITGGPVEVRDLALSLAEAMGLPLGTTPDSTWGGFTGDWSDHYAFVLAGVPVAYFEAWDWVGGDDPWWGQETPEGDILHSEADQYSVVVPEKVEMAAEIVAATAAALAQ